MSSYACKDSDRKEFVYASELKEINIAKDKHIIVQIKIVMHH